VSGDAAQRARQQRGIGTYVITSALDLIECGGFIKLIFAAGASCTTVSRFKLISKTS
jgi:hypothetical protein